MADGDRARPSNATAAASGRTTHGGLSLKPVFGPSDAPVVLDAFSLSTTSGTAAVTSITVTMPAGWYPDPDDPSTERYFDGETLVGAKYSSDSGSCVCVPGEAMGDVSCPGASETLRCGKFIGPDAGPDTGAKVRREAGPQ